MGATPADTQREINRLRGDMTAALDEMRAPFPRRRARHRGRRGAHLERPRQPGRLARATRARQPGPARRRRGRGGRRGWLWHLRGVHRRSRSATSRRSRLKRGVQQVRDELCERVDEGVEASRGSSSERGRAACC